VVHDLSVLDPHHVHRFEMDLAMAWTAGSSGVALFGYPIRSITPASDSSHLSIGPISYVTAGLSEGSLLTSSGSLRVSSNRPARRQESRRNTIARSPRNLTAQMRICVWKRENATANLAVAFMVAGGGFRGFDWS